MAVQPDYLEVRGLTVSFDGFKAVDGVDLTVFQSDLRFLIGPNGAGKTTIIDALTGLVGHRHGALRRGRADRAQVAPDRPARRRPHLPDGQRVHRAQRAAEPGHRRRSQRSPWALLGVRRAVPDVVAEALETVALVKERDKPAGVLSHGQKQWLEIGMLLVQNSRVLLLDEPVAGMSADERDATGELLKGIGADRTVIIVEHDMDFMRRWADSVTVLHQGKVLSEGSVADVQADPRVQEVYLGTGHGREGRCTDHARSFPISHGLRRDDVVHGVSFDVPERSVFAIMGHNGAGKTTLLKTILGLLPTRRGSDQLRGRRRHPIKTHGGSPRGMAYVPQGQLSFPQLSTFENLQLVADGRPNGAAKIDEMLDDVPGAEEVRDPQGRSALRWSAPAVVHRPGLDHRPKLIILDEPTEGIQPNIVAEIEQLVITLAEGGLSVLLVEQHVSFALTAAAGYAVLASGHITATGDGGTEAVGSVVAAMSI